MGKEPQLQDLFREPLDGLKFVVMETDEFEELVEQIGRGDDRSVVKRFKRAAFPITFPKITIEQHLAASIGLKEVEYTDEDRRTIARGLLDLIVLGSCHLIKKPKGIKRLDPTHVKIKLD